jgi:YVTN family beta-propeller protein
MRYRVLFLTLGLLVLIVTPAENAGYKGAQKHPIYVGSRVCAECHAGKGSGHQFNTWRLSKHARAYAALALPSAKEMALLSGIPGDPQQSVVCLGCHATAAEAEDWELNDTFHLEDGVQCEKCHGPGSEYMALDVMQDHEAAVAAGLWKPDRRRCELCHYAKGSHFTVHGNPPVDLDLGWETIAHRTPEDFEIAALPKLAASPSGPNYTGVQRCADCHTGPDMGYQFSHWRLGPHAQAYAVLATPEADEIAAEAGLEGEPQHSPTCLACHLTGGAEDAVGKLDTFAVDEGVGCEACHGPGSEYIETHPLGLPAVTRKTCQPCHQKAHGKKFDFKAASLEITHPTDLPPAFEAEEYKTPVNLALHPDGKQIFVACEASSTVIVIDAVKRTKIAEIPVGGQPTEVSFSPDGELAFVSNRLDDAISVINVADREVLQTAVVGDEPHGLITDPDGKFLYVLNTIADSISVLETTTFTEVKRLAASRNPWSMSLSPDGETILVTNNLSRFVGFREPLESEITVIDTRLGIVRDRLTVPDTNLIQGVDWDPSGNFALVTLNRTKSLIPMTRIVQGWTITNGLGIVWKDGRVDQVLLDTPNHYFPDAADVAITPDGRYALVTSSGLDQVAVVDLPHLISILNDATAYERETVLPNHLGIPVEFIIKMIPTGNSPRGIIIDNTGETAFVANALDDSVTAIDIKTLTAVKRIDLGGPQEITTRRWGDRLFHSAKIAFQRQFSCSSCHPDGHVDGITYDIEPDGLGFNPVDNRTLRGIRDTAPFKWTGLNPTLRRQCGPRLAVFFTRVEPFTPEELLALEYYISTIPRPPNRYRPLGAPLTDAQRRGKIFFERRTNNAGEPIPEEKTCVYCHFPPLFTSHMIGDVGTKMELDKHGDFDVPHLTNIYSTAPYLHNGIAHTLEELWTTYNPEDKHGVTNDMTKDQLNDLIEYLKTL